MDFFKSLCEELLKVGFTREDMIFYDGSQSEYRISIRDAKDARTYFLDFYIPLLKLNIEFNGEFWHARDGFTQEQINHWNSTHKLSYNESLEKEHKRLLDLSEVGIISYVVWSNDNKQDNIKKCVEMILKQKG